MVANGGHAGMDSKARLAGWFRSNPQKGEGWVAGECKKRRRLLNCPHRKAHFSALAFADCA